MSGFLPDYSRAEISVSPNFGPRRDGQRAGHDHPALYRHGDRAVGRGMAVRSGRARSRRTIWSTRTGRCCRWCERATAPGMPAAARGGADSDINSCSIGIEIANPGHAYGYPDFPAPDRYGDRALPRHCGAACHCARARARAFRCGARPQGRSRRKVSRGRELHAAGVGHYVEPAPIGGGRFLAAGERGEPVEALQSMLALYGYGVDISGRSMRPPKRWSPPSSGTSGPSGSTASPTGRRSTRCTGCWPRCRLTSRKD